MKQILTIASLTLLVCVLFSCSTDDGDDTPFVPVPPVETFKTISVETSYGTFRIWLFDETPLHKANFLKLTQEGFFDNLIFHRVIKNFVIQTGDPDGTGSGGPGYTIPAEFHDSLLHNYGAVGAARLPDNVNPEKASSGSQFYVVVDQNGEHSLDGKYTVFGTVFSGWNVIDSISKVKTGFNDKPSSDIYMLHVNIDYFTEKGLQDSFDFHIPGYQ